MMKRLLVCLTLAAFATVTSLQAGEATKDNAACSAQTKTSTCTMQTAAKSSCTAQTAEKASCCSTGKKVAKRNYNASVKGATLLVRR